MGGKERRVKENNGEATLIVQKRKKQHEGLKKAVITEKERDYLRAVSEESTAFNDQLDVGFERERKM